MAVPPPLAVKRETPGVEITRRLLQYLLSGDLTPGQRIPSERALAEALDVGRSTLREAIKSLSLLGLLEQRVGDGTYLSRSSSDLLPQVIEWGLLLGEQRLEDLLEARWYLEVQLAGWAAQRRSPEQLERLREITERMRAAGNDFDAYVQADIEFHLLLAEASGNSVLGNMLINVRSLLQAWASRVIHRAGETESSLAMHEPILAAVEKGDAKAARAAMEAHMERAERRLKASMPHNA
ncbi:FadR/GntR family transcriptional regulator [Streptomyces rugosispiralis]|uniref:FadR family transcriptional regulator n=1 Tax=Streptomyces rugosispiralis TaxID=2967341 RepID=A0ABT1URR2_9ACTN|nr:FadR/GntR family transcriptional regulator [Streptomyces rugosispiralis]MCQ8187805.1 FadR family transcriptional regulator [Streptomyces rugosispiralis]